VGKRRKPEDIEMATVEVRQVHKSFGGRQVLARLDLSMAEGELICLLGPSGCGKTTLLRIIAGFISADSGQVIVAGRDVTTLSASARRMGMVFQAYSLFPNMTALDNVRFGPRVAGTPKAEQHARAEHLLDLVGLSSHAQKYPHQLSGGQQQRGALARALAVQPQVLLLDEPLSALDAKVRVQLREEIRRIQRDTGVTTVLVTHDQEEALSISDRVAVMNEGRLLQVASPATIYREPADAFVARFIGAGAVLPGIAEAGAVRAGSLALPARAASAHAAGQQVEMFLRPEHVRLAQMNGQIPPGMVAADVREMTFLGSLTRVRLSLPDLPDGTGIWADLPSEQAEAFKPGSRVLASWDEDSPRVMAKAL
jgi:putative spermidine/putrescine transport system ATP-binding protein